MLRWIKKLFSKKVEEVIEKETRPYVSYPKGIAYVTQLDPPAVGKTKEVKINPFFIGRSLDSDLWISSVSVRRRHGQITRCGDSYYIENCNSNISPKVRVNDLEIEHRSILYSGDILTFGKIRVKFEVKYGKQEMS